MPATSLWPDFPALDKPRGMKQILEEAGADIAAKTNDVVEFVVYPTTDSLEADFRYDCRLFVPKAHYSYLLCRVLTGPTPFPASVVTPEGQEFHEIMDEPALRGVLAKLFQAEKTKEIVLNLIANFG